MEPDVESAQPPASPPSCAWCFIFFAVTSILVLAGVVFLGLIVPKYAEVFASLVVYLPPPTEMTLSLFKYWPMIVIVLETIPKL